MDNETLASLLRGRNRAGQPVDATANIIGPAMSALGNTIYGAGRGALTAMAGLPGDINQLITDNLGTLVNAQGLPTTKEIQDFLPLKPTTYEGKLAQKLGEFLPVNPTPIAKGAVAIAKPVGKAMGEQAYRMTEDMLQKQGMMPSIVPESKQIKDTAEEFANKIKELGFEADVKHSGSKAGASSYVSVSDPTTGRFVVDPYRFSGHSKGPYQAQFVNEVSDLEKQFPDIEKTLMAMREKGPAAGLQKQQFIQQKAEELIKNGVKPKTAYKQATEMAEKDNTVVSRKEMLEREIAKVEDYRGSHTAPNAKVYGGTIDKLEQIMPKDVYSQQGRRLYGINDPTIDHEWYMAALRAKGKPDAMIEVYRAVPKGVKNINNGDWVTTSKKYATDHGKNTLNGEYEIVSKKVKANTLSSEGYPYEFGYNE